MKHIEIDLNAPFEQSMRAALSLPNGGRARAGQEEVVDALRRLYTVAHGRAVQTSLGPIPIAPPIDPSLKEAPLSFKCRSELLAFVDRRNKSVRAASERVEDRHRAQEFPVHITPHNVRIGGGLRKFIGRKLSAVSRVAGDALGAELVVRGRSGEAHLFSVSARVALPGRDLQGNARHHNLHGAINQLVAKLTRLARKRKTRLRKPRRMLRQHAVMPWLAGGASLFAL